MGQTSATRTIDAPPERVFDVIAHAENFAEAGRGITNIEFLSESHRGVGTRFRETRLMRGREASTTLEVTEYEEPNRVRIVADEGGAIWDTVFTVTADGEGSRLSLVMDARPHTLLAKLTVPLFGRMVAKAVEADLDSVKAHCEKQ